MIDLPLDKRCEIVHIVCRSHRGRLSAGCSTSLKRFIASERGATASGLDLSIFRPLASSLVTQGLRPRTSS